MIRDRSKYISNYCYRWVMDRVTITLSIRNMVRFIIRHRFSEMDRVRVRIRVMYIIM